MVENYYKLNKLIPHYDNFHNRAIRFIELNLPRAGSLADIGCGNGKLLSKIAEKRSDAILWGVDHDPQTLSFISDNLAGSEKVNFINQDALEWLQGLKDSSLQFMVCSWVIHNWPIDVRRSFYQELDRVIAAPGHIVFIEKIAHNDKKIHNQNLYDQIALFFSCLESETEKNLLKDWVLHYIHDEEPELLMTEDEIEQEVFARYNFKILAEYREMMDKLVILERKNP